MTASKQPELPALTEEELHGLKYDRACDLLFSPGGRPSDPDEAAAARRVADELFESARRCLSAERELAELKALGAGAESRFFEETLESNSPDGPWSDPASRLVAKGPASVWSAPRRVGRYIYRKTRVVEYVTARAAERSLSEVKTERDELRAKVARLEKRLADACDDIDCLTGE